MINNNNKKLNFTLNIKTNKKKTKTLSSTRRIKLTDDLEVDGCGGCAAVVADLNGVLACVIPLRFWENFNKSFFIISHDRKIKAPMRRCIRIKVINVFF